MSAEKFCLRWNDFEANVSSAFRDLREEKDFFDVTLACEDSQIEAHKVILSACSPFFKNILRRHPHQHPLLYLKGVQMTELANVLNFMYMGEVNVAQEQLNNFLSVSEELQVKGLTQGGQHVQRKPQTVHNDLGISSKPPKKPKPALPSTFPPGASYSTNIADQENDPDIQEVAQVKPEPSQTASESDIHYQNDGAVALEDQYGYDDYEGDPNIVDTNVYDTSIDKDLNSEIECLMQKLDSGRWQCVSCGWESKVRARLWEHIESVHVKTSGYNCEICEKFCPSKNAYKIHKSRYHRQSVPAVSY